MKIKADFSKTVGNIRKDTGNAFPKAMMTNAQMAKNTATVNCGGEWRSTEYSAKLAEAVLNDERFKAFLNRHNAEAHIERGRIGDRDFAQVRVYYPESALK